MYEKIKKTIKYFLPEKLLFTIEPCIRFCYYLIYTGKKYQCPICGKHLRKFVRLNNGDLLCPNCGSISRNRRLWKILTSGYLAREALVLDFSPSRCLYRTLCKYPSIHYISSDFAGEFIADKQFDITQIELPDSALDIIICYHILEHIEDDKKAMKELYRILKKGGHCFIQTPFREGETYENEAIKSPEDRAKHFGQADHVRVYSVSGLQDRLAQCGFITEIKEFNEIPGNEFGLLSHETVLVATK
jgi:SAM-dependent methyltransferase